MTCFPTIAKTCKFYRFGWGLGSLEPLQGFPIPLPLTFITSEFRTIQAPEGHTGIWGGIISNPRGPLKQRLDVSITLSSVRQSLNCLFPVCFRQELIGLDRMSTAPRGMSIQEGY